MSFETFNIPQQLLVGVAALKQLVAQYRLLEASTLRLSLGADLSSAEFNEYLTMFETYKGWDSVDDWHDSHEYTYETKDGTQVKTTVHLDVFAEITHVVTTSVNELHLSINRHARRPFVSLFSEMPKDPKELPDIVMPSAVAIVKRRSFTRGTWQFHVAHVWTGANRTLAEEAQRVGNCVFAVDIHFVPDDAYWDNPHHTDAYVATSFLMKMVNVVSDEMVTVDVIS